jgi:hypothetical protein
MGATVTDPVIPLAEWDAAFPDVPLTEADWRAMEAQQERVT